ncbi:unnamed protein product, partial [Rotaria sp. Silwood2]
PKPKNKNDALIIDDDRDENDEEVANSFDINKWLNDASQAILGFLLLLTLTVGKDAK